jgi:N-methylhydantoinase A
MRRSARRAVPVREKRAWLGKRFQRVPVFDRDDLTPGQRIDGPAIVEESATVTVIHHSQSLRVDPYGVLVIQV